MPEEKTEKKKEEAQKRWKLHPVSPPDEPKSEQLPSPVITPEPKTKGDFPIMYKSDFNAGQRMMMRFLKGIDIKIKGKKVTTIYNWEFPDELVAKAFAHGMKAQLEGAEESEK